MISIPGWLTWLACAIGSPPIDFDTEIIPVLTKAGCNAGSCHGAAAGRGGFHLSLLGGDPAADHEAIVHELEGRRVNFARPTESLLLRKPTGGLPHQGGVVLDDDGLGAKRLLDWISAGAPRLRNRELARLEVVPRRFVANQAGTPIPLRAIAHFQGGESVDVTETTVFFAVDPAAVEIDGETDAATATATIRRPGQHVLIARFLDQIVPSRLVLPYSQQAFDLSTERSVNFVDEEILKSLRELGIAVSPPADDAAFLRRVRLDLTGRLPAPEEVAGFLGDPDPNKRVSLIDRLLESTDYAEFWTYRWAKLLRLQPVPNDSEGARTYHRWLRDRIAGGAAMDQVARSLLTAVGDTHEVGPANFSRTVLDARGQAELVSQVFLGARLQCANCHNHPLDRWTQDDYHGLAAVFARIERDRVVRVAPRGAVTNPRTGEPAVPRIPGVRDLIDDDTAREQFAQWLTRTNNPYFARAIVNRLWHALFGRGLVEPVDDLRATNPATHPELLDRLASDFAEHGYDLRHTLRLIALSSTYARSDSTTANNASDDRFYSHAYSRPLEPEVLADAIADVAGVPDSYGDEPIGTRAVNLIDPRTPAASLDILGRCSRQVSCEGDSAIGSLPARLHQLNGDLTNRKITAPAGRLHRLIAEGRSNEAIIREFYLRSLGRLPVDEEATFWRERLSSLSSREREEALEDLVWSLLNCRGFSTNH